MAANFSVWTVGIMGGALVNILYPAYLLTKNKSWHVLTESRKDLAWCFCMSIIGFCGITLQGKGMLVLGVLGASVGFGIQQSSIIISNMGVGFVFREWRGVVGSPRRLIALAVGCLVTAGIIMAYGNSLARH